MEVLAKMVYVILMGLVIGVGWVTGIQLTVSGHSADLVSLKYTERENERKYIDVLGRIDERLKNIEKK